MILRLVLHLVAVSALVAAALGPAFLAAAGLAETGIMGECVEGGCGYTALFLLFPIFWLVLSGLCIALWVHIYRKHLRHRLPA